MFDCVVSRPAVAVGTKGYRKQTLGVYLIDSHGVVDDFPTKLELLLGKEEPDYPPGKYTIHPASFAVRQNDFGSSELSCTRIKLVPTPAKK